MPSMMGRHSAQRTAGTAITSVRTRLRAQATRTAMHATAARRGPMAVAARNTRGRFGRREIVGMTVFGCLASTSYGRGQPGANPSRRPLSFAVAIGFLLAGCVTSSRQPVLPARPVTIDEIAAWSREGVAGQEIVRRLQESGAVFRLSSRDVIALGAQGVPGEVIDAMLQTWVDAESRRARSDAIRRAREAAWDPWWGPWWWDDPWWWGYPYSPSRRYWHPRSYRR